MDSTLVLLVDDQPDLVVVSAALLEQRGYEVMVSTSPMEALGLVAMRRPAIAMLDMNMPEMTGLELAQALLSRDQQIAVVFHSALDKAELIRQVFAYNGWIRKPQDSPAIAEHVHEALSRRPSRRSA